MSFSNTPFPLACEDQAQYNRVILHTIKGTVFSHHELVLSPAMVNSPSYRNHLNYNVNDNNPLNRLSENSGSLLETLFAALYNGLTKQDLELETHNPL